MQDGTRRDAAFRARQHRWYLDRLERAGTAFTVLAGPLDARVEHAWRLRGQVAALAQPGC